ncbi:MAG: adenosylmethionine--8-amino-7-oxononanoate transaminase [Bdellovibrio sp. CG11_big_fil_rev_8_21_14_0_20_39_38]|nr:MAG: adenosylmethionine--8-amino-7-oxononanoate transaminase [Bdellovibrio sp. CG22_combo_CG10-13_8_21_14_all_39_27]PIR35940.1 MAG: adenosylmethionine--8-amino-7-oxononanoate transaminase [Bdellovibrio sp. CG11_big_fil_rev_8_21_14_0_20_39_38]
MNYRKRDAEVIWHPYTQHFQTHEFPAIIKAHGNYLHLDNGEKVLDAISSWWVNLHGHSHPHITSRMGQTLGNLQQVMFAGFTHPYAIELSERILSLFSNRFSKVFFSDNGSTSVEVALKMCFQYWSNKGIKRNKIIAFKNSYHGDTFGSMSVADRNIFSKPFWPFLFEVELISPNSTEDLEILLKKYPESIAGMIYEPMIQGAGGMVIHNPNMLNAILDLAKDNKIMLIADEVMTGFGRTGKLFGSDHLRVSPDIVCLSKGLTGGVLPLGLTLTTKEIYEAFLSSDKTKTLFHGHSFTGNALSCSAALASLDLLLADECQKQIQWITKQHISFASIISSLSAPIHDTRTLGTVLAVEFKTDSTSGYLNSLGQTMSSYFLKQGILLRPLGNTLYVLPPYSFGESEIDKTYSAILAFIRSHF